MGADHRTGCVRPGAWPGTEPPSSRAAQQPVTQKCILFAASVSGARLKLVYTDQRVGTASVAMRNATVHIIDTVLMPKKCEPPRTDTRRLTADG